MDTSRHAFVIKDTRILFLAIRAIRQGSVNATVIGILNEVLLKSPNAAIANRALMLDGEVKRMKANGYYV